MINRNQIEPEPLAQIVFVGFSKNDPEDRDIYISFKGYTAGYSASPKQREFLDEIDLKGELTEAEKQKFVEAFHYYIKNPDGKFLRFEFDQYGGLKEIDPEKDLNTQKLEWIRYEKDKFIELDKAEQVLSFQLYEDNGNYRIRKTFLSQDVSGDVFTEKPATPEEQELFDSVFKHQIKHLYSILEIHDTFSQAGGIAIFNKQHELIGEVSKETLIKAGVKDQAGEHEFMLKYFKEQGMENAYYLPSETRLIPEAFIEKFMVDVEGTDNNGKPYTYREFQIKTGDYTNTISDTEIALNHAFGSLLDVKESLKDVALQGKIARVPKFEQILNRTAQQPFIQRYEPEKGKFTKLKPVRVSPRKAKETVFNYIELNTEVELSYFDHLVLSAYKTWNNLYPEEPPTLLDIANILHHPKGKRSSLDSRSKLIKDIANSFDNLQTTLCKINFKKQAQLSKSNEKFQQYINSGGSGIIKFPFVSGVQRPIKTANGDVLDGIVPDGKQSDRLLDFYINMTGQVRTVTGEALTNPLRANKRDLEIFHYLLLKVCSMPYHNKTSLFSEKQHYKDLLAGAETEPEPFMENDTEIITWKSGGEEQELEPEPLPDSPEILAEKMLELEAKTQKQELTINIDTLLEELKLIKPNSTKQQINKLRNTIKGRMEKVFEYWKQINLINGYSENTKPNERGVQSFTLRFFTEPKD